MLASRKAVLPNIDLNQDQELILPSIDLNDFDELISPSIDLDKRFDLERIPDFEQQREDWNRLFNEYQQDLELRDKGDFIELN